jgi:type 1 fimbria pilin
MKFNSLFLALFIAGGLFSGASYAITGTTSLTGIFESTVTPGTCNVTVTDGSGSPTTEINFGDMYKQDIGTRTEPFNINLTECYGITNATVTAQAGSGNACSGSAYAPVTNTTNTAVEIWKTAADSGTQLACATGTASNALTNPFSLSANAQSWLIPMVARWVIANGKTASDVVAGNAESLVTFSVTYQ